LGRSILIIEDEKEIRDLLAHYLRKDGFRPSVAPDGETGLALARAARPDLVVLDILLPGMDGLEVLREIRAGRQTAGIPVIMLTAKGDETDRVVGLELGADDYVPKPFSPREVVARIKAVFRRSASRPPADEAPLLTHGSVRLDAARHEVRDRGRPVPLTSKEFGILQALLSAGGRVLTRAAILSRVWGEDTHVVERAVDVHIANIRRKIPALAEAIQTVKDVGYRVRER
jgi:DNA-binding response OmpR family regulator